MSLAFLGVQRLVGKVASTCAAIASPTPAQSLFSSPLAKTPSKSRVNPSAWRPHPLLHSAQSIEISQTTNGLAHLHSSSSAIPLRVMRVMEQGGSKQCAGRMVMSGSFADVCAELDRMAAIESGKVSLRK